MNNLKGFLALISTALILGTFGVLIRQLAVMFTDPGQVLARSFFATLIITAIVLYRKMNPFQLDKKNVIYVGLFSLVFSLSILSFTFSANMIKVTNSLFMLFVGSLTSTALLGKIFFKESFSARHITSLLLVLLGLCFFVYPFQLESLSMGLAFGIGAGIFKGSAHTLRKLMKDVKREVVVFYQSLSGVILATAFLLVSGQQAVTEFHMSAVLVAVLFGALLVSIGYLLMYGFSHFDVNWGTIILATELFFAMIINMVFLNEFPTAFELIGGLLIFSGTVVTSLSFNFKPQS